MIELIFSAVLFLPKETTVVADSELAGYRVTGQMFLDESFTGSESTKRTAATCTGCTWLLTNYCKRDNPYQVITSCDLPVLACETELGSGVKKRIWHQVTPDSPWQDLGVVCLTPKGPVTPKVITTVIKEEAVIFLPELNPTATPPGDALVKLPVYFSANQPSVFGPKLVKVAGFEVLLTAYPTWTWNFQNQKITTRSPNISNIWNKTGGYQVSVIASWNADWQIDGTVLEMAPNLEQKSSLFIQIRPAWAQLTR